jgi:hypothetical protein
MRLAFRPTRSRTACRDPRGELRGAEFGGRRARRLRRKPQRRCERATYEPKQSEPDAAPHTQFQSKSRRHPEQQRRDPYARERRPQRRIHRPLPAIPRLPISRRGAGLGGGIGGGVARVPFVFQVLVLFGAQDQRIDDRVLDRKERQARDRARDQHDSHQTAKRLHQRIPSRLSGIVSDRRTCGKDGGRRVRAWAGEPRSPSPADRLEVDIPVRNSAI